MPSHVQTSALSVAVISALVLAVSGCGQNVPPDNGPVAGGAGSDASQRERQASYDEGPSDGSAVKRATAETRIEPPRHASEDSNSGELAKAPEGDAPAPLPTANAPLPLDNIDAALLTMPKVSLSEHHAATCLVGVGDAFPDLKLPDLAGQQTALSDRYGEKLTLVVFWHGKQPNALEQLADLARYHQPRFGDEGLSIVAINTGDDAQLAGELAKQAGTKFLVLCDIDGAAFKQVATEKIPRSYLLDPSGKVLWFDLEYSPTTRRELVRAIRYSLAHP